MRRGEGQFGRLWAMLMQNLFPLDGEHRIESMKEIFTFWPGSHLPARLARVPSATPPTNCSAWLRA